MNPGNSQQALQSILDFSNTRKGANDYLTEAMKTYGVGDAQSRATQLRTSINNTQNLLDGVGESVAGRTAGSLVTGAQRDRLVAMEQAPIAGQLRTQGQAYDVANTDYKDLLGQAQMFSTNAYGGDNDKLSALKTIYEGLAQREAEERAKAEAERAYQLQVRQIEEQQRQFNASQAAAAKAAASGLSGLGALTKAGAKAPSMTQRGGGAFNFTDAGGAAISAAKYAQLTGTDLGTLLAKMGQAGDKYAAQLYNQFKGNQALLSKGVPDAWKKTYSSIFWGT